MKYGISLNAKLYNEDLYIITVSWLKTISALNYFKQKNMF